MKSQKYLLLATLLLVFTAACKKTSTSVGGKGGSAVLNIYPQHHEVAKNLISFTVYIKYNTQDAPSNGVYDDSVMCSNHDSLVSCSFSGLKNGNYYLYGYGYDTSISQHVKGGAPYTITAQQSQNVNLPVSE